MSEDQFTKLFKYMQKGFSEVENRLDELNEKFDHLQSSVDAYAKQVLDLTQEHLMLARKVDRLESWVQQVAQKTGVKLDY